MRAEVIDEKECARRLNEAREEVAQLREALDEKHEQHDADMRQCVDAKSSYRRDIAELGATIQGYKTRIATLEAENRELKKSLKVFKRLHEADAAAFDEALDGTE